MAKKEKIEFGQMTEDELRGRLAESREKAFQLKFQNATAPLKNPHEITIARRDVARCMTFLKQIDLKKKAGAGKTRTASKGS
jgi:large subunit ribosomal protein L29